MMEGGALNDRKQDGGRLAGGGRGGSPLCTNISPCSQCPHHLPCLVSARVREVHPEAERPFTPVVQQLQTCYL